VRVDTCPLADHQGLGGGGRVAERQHVVDELRRRTCPNAADLEPLRRQTISPRLTPAAQLAPQNWTPVRNHATPPHMPNSESHPLIVVVTGRAAVSHDRSVPDADGRAIRMTRWATVDLPEKVV
jgi:hypothetical protein